VGDYSIAFADSILTRAHINPETSHDITMTETDIIPSHEEVDESSRFRLEEFQDEGTEQVPGHQAVFLGDVKLSDFKQVLSKAGIQAEFVEGSLVCGDVALKREEIGGTSRINFEGILSEDYFRIRNLLYSLYEIF